MHEKTRVFSCVNIHFILLFFYLQRCTFMDRSRIASMFFVIPGNLLAHGKEGD